MLVPAATNDNALKIIIYNRTMSSIQEPIGKIGVLKMLDVSAIFVENGAGSRKGDKGVSIPERRHTVYCDN